MKFLLFFIVIFSFKYCIAQKLQITSINVSSSFYNNKKLIIQGGSYSIGNGYNNFKFVDTSYKIEDAVKFIAISHANCQVKVEINYPHPFQFAFFDTAKKRGYGSRYFFVGKEAVNVKVSDLIKDKVVLTGKISKLNREYFRLQNSYRNYVDLKSLNVHNLPGKLGIMQKYVSKNPDSYVALWDLILDYPILRAEEDKRKVLSIAEMFSDKLKSTKTYKTLIEILEKDLQFVNGSFLPNFFLDDKDSLLNIASRNKFTLIDFWFSSCQPCLKQFDALKEIYASNITKGFQIVGISVEGENQKARWEQVIERYGLKWIQHLDTNGVIAQKLFIKAFPSNFLIDHTGKIVSVDIEPTALQEFLMKEFN